MQGGFNFLQPRMAQQKCHHVLCGMAGRRIVLRQPTQHPCRAGTAAAARKGMGEDDIRPPVIAQGFDNGPRLCEPAVFQMLHGLPQPFCPGGIVLVCLCLPCPCHVCRVRLR
ncbi:hypothetical protein AA0243_0123 [Novacetimonas hansenii NRIC 0243]|nr:hypothetical protein AA0243_0123 [Novacetimonas hansenii NRIC 0243]